MSSNYNLDSLQVVDSQLADPPASPSVGHRYLVIATASGAWAGKETQVAGWNGSDWDFYIPNSPVRIYVSDVARTFVYSSGSWVDDTNIDIVNPLLAGSYEGGIVASNVHAQGQRPLTKRMNVISVIEHADDCVTMPPSIPGGECIIVFPVSTYELLIYPALGDECGGVDGAGTILPNLPFKMHDESTLIHFYCYEFGHWATVNTFVRGAIFNGVAEFATVVEMGTASIATKMACGYAEVDGVLRRMPERLAFGNAGGTSCNCNVQYNNFFEMSNDVSADWDLTLTGGKTCDCGMVSWKQPAGGGKLLTGITIAGSDGSWSVVMRDDLSTINTAAALAPNAKCTLYYEYKTISGVQVVEVWIKTYVPVAFT